MSVGHEFTVSEVADCNAVAVEGFEQSFLCDFFITRRFNEHKGQYEIVNTIPLLGHDFIAGEQMSLFDS